MATTKTASDLTVADLERLLDDRKLQLEDLTKKRDSLRSKLEQVEQRIGALAGHKTTLRAPRRSPGKRPKNAKSLHQTIIEILTKNKKGFPLAMLAERVLATGYKTNSSDFKNVLYQCLYNSKTVKHDEKTSHYVLT